MDLADLAGPTPFRAPPFGDLHLELLLAPFRVWATSGDSSTRWSGGYDFVRDLLRDQVRDAASGESLDHATIAGLSTPQLDAIAEAIVFASGRFFAPRLIASGQKTRPFRRRREDEVYEIGAREDETPAAQLLRLVRDWVQDERDRTALTTRIIHRDIADIVGRSTHAFELAGVSRSLRDLQAIRSPLEEAVKSISASSAFARASVDLSRVGIAAQGLSVPDWSKTLDFGRSYRSVFADLDRVIGISAGAEIGVPKSVLDTIRGLDLGPAWKSQLADISAQSELLRVFNRQFDLKIPATTIAALAIGLSNPFSDVSRVIAGTSIIPPGFQMAGALGVQGLAPPGVVADVLKHYSQDDSEAPIFATVLEHVQMLDDPDFGSESVSRDEMTSFWGRLSAMIANERDPVRIEALLNFAAFLVAVASFVATLADNTSREVAGLRRDVVEVSQELKTLREEERARDADDAERTEKTRYLHAKAPLRAEPHGQGVLIRIIYPDQRLEIIDERDGWVKVQVFDYHTDAITSGWVSRRWLRRTPIS